VSSTAGVEILTRRPGPGHPAAVCGLHFDTISRRAFARRCTSSPDGGRRAAAALVRKYAIPRSAALGGCWSGACRDGNSAGPMSGIPVSIVALIVFYFSVSPMVRMLGHADAYSARIWRRKAQVLDFVRHGLFANPEEMIA